VHWTLHPATELDAFRDAWEALNAAGPRSPLLEPEFVGPLLTHFGTGRERLGVYGPPDSPAAMALLQPGKRGSWQTFQPSQAPIGLWLAQPALDMGVVLGGLLGTLPGIPVSLGITQQDPDLHPRPQPSRHLRTQDYISTARVTITGSFEDYWSARGKNLRHNLKRQRKRLDREGVTSRLEILTEPGDVASAIEDYGRLEGGGWKRERGTAVHPDNPQGRYYRSMLESFCSRRCGLIYRYRYGDRVVASDLCVLRGGTLVVLKTARDAEQKVTSPALLMRQAALESIFSNGLFRVVEFYGRVMDWHEKFTGEIRTMYHATYDRWPLLRELSRFGRVGLGKS
jgi:CelD/BcsL family acetyltransferase involved in cellulose biosynthesis